MVEIKTRQELVIEELEKEIDNLAEELEELSDMNPQEYAIETQIDRHWEIDFYTSDLMYSFGYLNYKGMKNHKENIEAMIKHYKENKDENN